MHCSLKLHSCFDHSPHLRQLDEPEPAVAAGSDVVAEATEPPARISAVQLLKKKLTQPDLHVDTASDELRTASAPPTQARPRPLNIGVDVVQVIAPPLNVSKAGGIVPPWQRKTLSKPEPAVEPVTVASAPEPAPAVPADATTAADAEPSLAQRRALFQSSNREPSPTKPPRSSRGTKSSVDVLKPATATTAASTEPALHKTTSFGGVRTTIIEADPAPVSEQQDEDEQPTGFAAVASAAPPIAGASAHVGTREVTAAVPVLPSHRHVSMHVSRIPFSQSSVKYS